ncbi:hypothetical protein HSX10_09455 [Winogradskyella undariae]|uniref:hypothetical protein n=1 Tax=Winogradskyella undariae TaxID=1285465 RepID=UPI00156AE010|nr:hypothetical protein [Winogradskyella undariae]NRR91787.1 hypothetical protein [Winogradskyella undariae]
MKNTFRRYLSLIVVLLLSIFGHLQANEVNSSQAYNSAIHHLSVSINSAVKLGKALNKTTFISHHKNNDDRRYVEIIESNNAEDEEASVKKLYYKDILEIAFINALVFEHSSNHLERNIYRPQSDIHEANLRLHIQFQVFII